MNLPAMFGAGGGEDSQKPCRAYPCLGSHPNNAAARERDPRGRANSISSHRHFQKIERPAVKQRGIGPDHASNCLLIQIEAEVGAAFDPKTDKISNPERTP